MAKTYEYVSDRRLLYFTQKLKEHFPTASDFIDDTASAADKLWSSQKTEQEIAALIDDTIADKTATGADTHAYSIQKILTLFEDVAGLQFLKVDTLPTTDQKTNAIYLVPIRIVTSVTTVAGVDSKVDKNTFVNKIAINGTYTFTYVDNGTDPASWQYESTDVTLADYGITFSGTATPVDGDTVTVVLASGTNPNVYEEYIWLKNDDDPSESKYELIGTTEADLSGYVKDEDMIEITTSEIDTIITTVFS